MNAQEAAAALNGNEYGEEGSRELFAEMKAAGLVAVFGASDDLMEMRGAIDDEVGAWNGGVAAVTPAGLLTNECEVDDCPYFAKLKKTARTVEAKWDSGDGFAWQYDTTIPHEKFVIVEDGEQYCEGIVFALADCDSGSDPQGEKPSGFEGEASQSGGSDSERIAQGDTP